MNYLVETKQEYTIQLVNILTPLLYEGVISIYKDAKEVAKKGEELKIFQGLLRQIPKWNINIITLETNRILTNSDCSEWLEDLVKAVVKSNIILLTNSTPGYSFKYLDEKSYRNIKLSDFIHKCYIECAREIYNNPFLFYHKYEAIDIKRNQRDSFILIKECIKEGIRKLLPVRHILKEYLGNSYKQEEDNNFDTSISQHESSNLKNLLTKDLYNHNKKINNITHKSVIDPRIINKFQNNITKKISNISDNKPLRLSCSIENNLKGGSYNKISEKHDEHRNRISEKHNEHRNRKPEKNDEHRNRIPEKHNEHRNRISEKNDGHRNRISEKHDEHRNRISEKNDEHRKPEKRVEHRNKISEKHDEHRKPEKRIEHRITEKNSISIKSNISENHSNNLFVKNENVDSDSSISYNIDMASENFEEVFSNMNSTMNNSNKKEFFADYYDIN